MRPNTRTAARGTRPDPEPDPVGSESRGCDGLRVGGGSIVSARVHGVSIGASDPRRPGACSRPGGLCAPSDGPK